jgi:hypothetical protein
MVFPEAVGGGGGGRRQRLTSWRRQTLLSCAQVAGLGVMPVGDKHKAEVWREALQAARAAVQQAAAVAATAAAATTHASATSATATTAVAVADRTPR